MTGFARTEGAAGGLSWVWEIRSVNGRSLDIRMRTPAGFDRCGEAARRAIAASVRRGACHVSLVVNRASQTPGVRVNLDVARKVLEAFATLERPPGVGPLTMDAVLAVRGVVEAVDADAAPDDAAYAAIESSAGEMVAAMVAMRAAEGAALEQVLRGQLDQMATLVEAAENAPGRRPEAIRARLGQQLAMLAGAPVALDPQRLHQEAMLMASRADIREELDRLKTHVAAARALLDEGGPVGRRLDFLAQELSREANTLCAKAGDPGLTATGLELKTVVEQFREQVQNVE
ncbi:YicC/YloC family endoribonuclease [Camelimonas abortus]|uniref:YicC/YloC family endoribonuclease n=1 Tax=Camelimonas abortus TaxID=1017184 RepID=A0ABV7LGS3_9HYPH